MMATGSCLTTSTPRATQQALLRGPAGHRPHRDAGHRAAKKASAPSTPTSSLLGLRRQPGRVQRPDRAWQTIMGLSSPRRPPDPRVEVSSTSRFFRSVQYGVDRPRAARLRPHPRAGTTAPAADHHLRATAYPRAIDFEIFGEIAREVGAYHVSDIAHLSGWWSPAATRADTLRRRGLHHDAQDPARPRGGLLLCRGELADRVDRAVFPGLQGGPHMHTITASPWPWRAQTQEFLAYARQIVRNAAPCEALSSRASTWSRGHRQPPDAHRPAQPGIPAESWPRRSTGGIVTNYNTVPATRRRRQPQRPAPRHAGRDDARHARGEIGAIARLMRRVVDHIDSDAAIEDVGKKALLLCSQFPCRTTSSSPAERAALPLLVAGRRRAGERGVASMTPCATSCWAAPRCASRPWRWDA